MMADKIEMELAAVERMQAGIKEENKMVERLASSGLKTPTTIEEAIEVSVQLKLSADEMDVLQELANL